MQWILIICFLLWIFRACPLLTAECPELSGTNCSFNRPHYVYSNFTTVHALDTLYFNSLIHCTHYLSTFVISARKVVIDSNAVISGSNITINADEVYISGVINTNGRGFASDEGSGSGSPPESLYDGAIGGGYNGPGRTRCHGSSFGTSVEFGMGEFGDSEEDITFADKAHYGSGGVRGWTASVLGGRGGGSVQVFAKSFLAVEGRISADGQPGMPGVDGSCDGGGGGAGGSIVLFSPVVNGSGELRAVGGIGGMPYNISNSINVEGCSGGRTYGTPGGNGEGGRIYVVTPSVKHALTFTVKGAKQEMWDCVAGGDGQIFFSTTRYLNPTELERLG